MQDINLSKQHREELIELCETLKIKSPEDAASINNIIKFIRDQKYGLVFEKHQEQVDVDLITKVPVFVEDKNKRINLDTNTDSATKYNFLLEGDNLHSLKLLEKTHKGCVDVIYIDPPYNTGNKDFVYNDKYIVEEDSYRHSKWLSFMQTRLKIAYNLLKEDGIIFISIDDNEYSQLKILCDEIFGEDNKLSIHHIQVRYANKNLNEKKDFQEVCEYVLIYSKNAQKFKANKPYEEYSAEPFCYEIIEGKNFEETTIGGRNVKIFKKGNFEIIKHPVGDFKYLKATWASGSVVKGNASGKFFETHLKPRKEIDGLGTLYKVEGIGEDGLGYRYFTGPQKTSATQGLFYSGVPTSRLEEIKNGISKKFRPIPNLYDFSPDFGNIRHEGGVGFNSGKKPIKMLKQFINYHQNKNVVVLDFFAGSGSTGHAVIDLNKEDGGNRKFILCTNNENNICEEITYQRLKNVITGIRSDGSKYSDGVPANLKYFKAEMIDRNDDDLDEKLLDASIPLIELENFEDIEDKNSSVFIAYSDEDLDEFEENFDKENNLVKTIYVAEDVCLSETQEQLFVFNNIKVKTIPNNFFREL